jgi:hypothetical protein
VQKFRGADGVGVRRWSAYHSDADVETSRRGQRRDLRGDLGLHLSEATNNDGCRRGPACELELQLVHGEHDTGENGDHNSVTGKTPGKGRKGRLAHREDMGMVGEDGGCCTPQISVASREEEDHDWEA